MLKPKISSYLIGLLFVISTLLSYILYDMQQQFTLSIESNDQIVPQSNYSNNRIIIIEESEDNGAKCFIENLNQLYYSPQKKQLYYCDNKVLVQIALDSPAVFDGENGTDGIDGKTMIVQSVPEQSGENCSEGGIQYFIGFDEDNSGLLEMHESISSQYICNGVSANFPSTFLFTNISTASFQQCSAGGYISSFGYDNGTGYLESGNTILDDSEIEYQTLFCNKFQSIKVPNLNLGSVRNVVTYDDKIFFSASEEGSGDELFSFDPINQSSWIVADINQGNGSSNVSNIMTSGYRLFFSADDGVFGTELWTYDTRNNTVWMVADINPGLDGSSPNSLRVVGTKLIFVAGTVDLGSELWIHDLMNSSTSLVSDICEGFRSSNPTFLLPYEGIIYFQADDCQLGAELWSYDVMNNSISLVRDLIIGSESSSPSHLYLMNNSIIFGAYNFDGTYSLWSYNIINNMTNEITCTENASCRGPAGSIVQIKSILYYVAYEYNSGYEIWAYNSFNHSIWQIADICVGTCAGSVGDLVTINERLLFGGISLSTGAEIWIYDPSTFGLTLLIDICPGACWGIDDVSFTVMGSSLYFNAHDSEPYNSQLYMIYVERSIILN